MQDSDIYFSRGLHSLSIYSTIPRRLATMASAQWLDDAFNDARRDFLSEIPTRYKSEFSRFGTIDHVYQEIDDIQLQQEKTRSLIALNRIHPYLIGLGDYFGAVETFVQVKPEVLCLIWVRL